MRNFGLSNLPVYHTAVVAIVMVPFTSQDLLVLLEVCTFIQFPWVFNFIHHSERKC